MDTQAAGGLGLSTRSVGVLYGGIGVACLLAGGVLGGWAIARAGLRRMMWPMVALTHLPNLLFVALALAQPGSTTVIAAALAFEQFGYGFGFTAYTVYTLRVAAGAGTAAECPRPTSHYALCTGLMALGMMLPGLWSGALQAALGYVGFFAWVCAASLVSVVVVAWCMRRQRWLAE
jgi:PAT family beta-lactamase induction signal transducer AmpG